MDTFEMELNSPLTKEDWNLIMDANMEVTENVQFHTPNGKNVKFIPVRILQEIKNEILEQAFSVVNPKNTYEYIYVLDLDNIEKIIDKYA